MISTVLAMTWLEMKLLWRDPGAVVLGLVFPAALLLALGALPGFGEVDPGLGGARLIDLYTPIVLILTFALVGITSIAAQLTAYRTSGVLRRLRVTPVGPARLLAAHILAHLAFALLAVVLAAGAAVLVHDVPAPEGWLGSLVALVLAASCLFSIGLVVGAVSSSQSAAGMIGTLVWLPLMVLAGLWFPREAMPTLMRRASDLSPGGAAVDAVQQAWFSGGMSLSSLAVLAASTAVAGLVAVTVFRWE